MCYHIFFDNSVEKRNNVFLLGTYAWFITTKKESFTTINYFIYTNCHLIKEGFNIPLTSWKKKRFAFMERLLDLNWRKGTTNHMLYILNRNRLTPPTLSWYNLLPNELLLSPWSTRNIIKKYKTNGSSLSWRIPQSLKKKNYHLCILSLAIFILVCGPHVGDQPNIDICKLSKPCQMSQPNQSMKVKQYFQKTNSWSIRYIG
jgi:hypothetical protein